MHLFEDDGSNDDSVHDRFCLFLGVTRPTLFTRECQFLNISPLNYMFQNPRFLFHSLSLIIPPDTGWIKYYLTFISFISFDIITHAAYELDLKKNLLLFFSSGVPIASLYSFPLSLSKQCLRRTEKRIWTAGKFMPQTCWMNNAIARVWPRMAMLQIGVM